MNFSRRATPPGSLLADLKATVAAERARLVSGTPERYPNTAVSVSVLKLEALIEALENAHATQTKGMTMDTEAQKAIDVLVEIAEDTEVEPDTRIRAACSILDLAKFKQANAVPAHSS